MVGLGPNLGARLPRFGFDSVELPCGGGCNGGAARRLGGLPPLESPPSSSSVTEIFNRSISIKNSRHQVWQLKEFLLFY